MSTHPYLTVHTLTALPSHNLNRDENGAPKQVVEGGVTRARLSSQSLKRAARVEFERQVERDAQSVRTKVAADVVIARVEELMGKSVPKKTAEAIATRVAVLTRDTEKDDRKDTIVWLSADEIERVAHAFVNGREDADVVQATSTRSLAIAAFGRMFANAPGLSTPAAIAVSDSTTTHAATIELDYFAAVDDVAGHGGAGQLGFTMQTTGVYYRSFTIDRAQLARNWDLDLATAEAETELRHLVRGLTLALPSGRAAGSAPYTLPALVIAEPQAHRVAYDFHAPVTASETGYLDASIAALLNKAADAEAFDPDLFGERFYTGTEAARHLPNVTTGSLAGFTDFVLGHIRAGA